MIDNWYLYIVADFRRRKFRSQTSDNMDRWKAEMGRVREEKRRRKKISKRKSSKKVGEKVGKSRSTMFFQWFVAPEGRKVGSLKRRVRSQLARWVMKNSTPLWREAHFEVKMYKTHQFSDHFWKLRCRKSARRCGAKHIWKSKCTKHLTFGALLEVEMWKKCAPLSREAHVDVNMLKDTTCSDQFWTFRCRFAWQAQGIVHLVQSEQNVRVFQNRWQVWAMWGIWRGSAKMFSVAGAVQETCSSELLGGPGTDWFPERGWILEHQIFRFAEMILRDRCSASYDPVSPFRGRRNSLDKWIGKIAKRIGTRPSALHSTFHFWQKSRRTVSFLMLSISKIEEGSQNSFVFDVVKFKNWGRLAELFRFWCNWGSLAK